MDQILMELENIKNDYKSVKKIDLSDDQAFEFLCAYFFCFSDKGDFKSNIYNIEEIITNGTNDGGNDFVYFDDENFKVICAQCKNSENFSLNDIISELNKMSSTYYNFKKVNTGIYNSRLKSVLQNAIDRLPDENEDNIQYVIFSTKKFNKENVMKKLSAENNCYDIDSVIVFDIEDIVQKIDEVNKKVETASYFKMKIDKANNYLKYENDDVAGIMVNLSSESLTQMYNKYIDNGLLDMNIRKFVPNKAVDEGINRTLDSDRENFWFLNNGIIIACETFSIDGNTISVENFSIVNGGQTTYKIGNYKGVNRNEFFIPCKIIEINSEKKYLYSKIAETTNSQKPITQRDLKSNSPEMKAMQNWLEKNRIYFDIKRGVKADKNKYDYKIKNDELGQCILSFVYQQPGTARSGKKVIFENDTYYKKIFKQKYEKDLNKSEFIFDLISLHKYYSGIEQKLKAGSALNADQKIILGNSKFIIFAIYGFMYLLENKDVKFEDLANNTKDILPSDYIYSKFISNNKEDDFESRLEDITVQIIYMLEAAYEKAKNQGHATSVSNLFKTDKKYKEIILIQLYQTTQMKMYKQTYIEGMHLFSRNFLD